MEARSRRRFEIETLHGAGAVAFPHEIHLSTLRDADHAAAMSIWRRTHRSIRARWKRAGLRLFGPTSSFLPSPVVTVQQIDFPLKSRQGSVVCDYRTPLYEMVAEVVDYDCYQLERCDFSAGNGSVVIDAGANVGVSALVLADRFQGRVLCLEPVPENCEWLRRNIERNAVSRAEVLTIGLAGRSRRDWLWRDPEQSVSGHFDPGLSPQAHRGLLGSQADFLSITDLLVQTRAEEVVLLKLDVEGAEHEIIEALDPATARRIQQITMEVHDLETGQNSRQIARRLQFLGYQIRSIPERLGRKGLSHILAQRK